MNYTITVPEGTTNHGNPQLLCTPARWYDYILFFFANYLAHAATVVPVPGQDMEASIFAVSLALILPGNAIARSVTVILRRVATERKNPLKRAARAGALCIVLKKPKTGYWANYLALRQGRNEDIERRGNNAQSETTTPVLTYTSKSEAAVARAPRTEDEILESNIGDQVRPTVEREVDLISQPSERWHNPILGYEPVPDGSHIHGEYWLHKDYYLALVPPAGLPDLKLDVDEEPSPSQNNSDPEISQFHHSNPILPCSHNIPKLLVGLIQSIWAIITIYQARGDQVKQYGYAAFGLTVAPYATMSIINTIANLSTPEYPSIFVLRTQILTDLEQQNKACFNGALSVVKNPESHDDQAEERKLRRLLAGFGEWLDAVSFPDPTKPFNLGVFITCMSFFVSLIPLAIVGGLSGFHNGNSTQMERGFTMSWLILGIVYGIFLERLISGDPERPTFELVSRRPNGATSALLFVLVFATPVFGGMAMVGKMLHEFGVCTLLRE